MPVLQVRRVQGGRVTPLVVLCPGSRDWSYDFTARALQRHLGDRYDFRIAYENEPIADGADLVVDFWWRGTIERDHGRRTLKQVSSHRWARRSYGAHTPETLIGKHLALAGGVVVPSLRLQRLIPGSMLAPKGFEPDAFRDRGLRGGDLRVGWAGNPRYGDKRVAVLREAWPSIVVTEERLPYDEMPRWYNAIDVITVASDAEGDPRPLIEGLACGCFPVVVDVGIVPELVRHGENGLIVERTPEAFRAAFEWCRENLDYVRAAGRRNAEQMLRTRTWAACMPAWAAAFDTVISRKDAP